MGPDSGSDLSHGIPPWLFISEDRFANPVREGCGVVAFEKMLREEFFPQICWFWPEAALADGGGSNMVNTRNLVLRVLVVCGERVLVPYVFHFAVGTHIAVAVFVFGKQVSVFPSTNDPVRPVVVAHHPLLTEVKKFITGVPKIVSNGLGCVHCDSGDANGDSQGWCLVIG